MLIPDGVAWLKALPGVVDELAAKWELVIRGPFPGSSVSWVAPAERHSTPVVPKVQWPHDECEHEAADELLRDLAPTQGDQVLLRRDLLGPTRWEAVGRLDRLAAELGLDRDRALGWTIGQTMAWAFSSSCATQHFATVRWLPEAR